VSAAVDACFFCGGRETALAWVWWGFPVTEQVQVDCCWPRCDEGRVAMELRHEAYAGVPCARTWILANRTGFTAERLAAALAVLKAGGLAVEDEALDMVWGWRGPVGVAAVPS